MTEKFLFYYKLHYYCEVRDITLPRTRRWLQNDRYCLHKIQSKTKRSRLENFRSIILMCLLNHCRTFHLKMWFKIKIVNYFNVAWLFSASKRNNGIKDQNIIVEIKQNFKTNRLSGSKVRRQTIISQTHWWVQQKIRNKTHIFVNYILFSTVIFLPFFDFSSIIPYTHEERQSRIQKHKSETTNKIIITNKKNRIVSRVKNNWYL